MINPSLRSRAVHDLVCTASFILLSIGSEAQQVVASAGASFTNATRGIAFTIGEPIIATDAASAHIITQGFHQPSADISTVVAALTESAFDVVVFPVPATTELNIRVDGSDDPLTLELLDAAGRVVSTAGVFRNRTTVDVASMANGCYTLRLLRSRTPFSLTQIIIAR